MADPVLHIKDSYYFEVPKMLYPYDYRTAVQFPDDWVSLDPKFQEWEAGRLFNELTAMNAGLPAAKSDVLGDWHHWVHSDHANFAKPLQEFLEAKYQGYRQKFVSWKATQQAAAAKKKDASLERAKRFDLADYFEQVGPAPAEAKYREFLLWRDKAGHEGEFARARHTAGDKNAIRAWKEEVHEGKIPDWDKATIDAYNAHLSGKILIPQPFGKLRNLYEAQSTILDQRTGWINRHDFGFCISKYMVIEAFIGLILVLIFSGFAQRIASGRPPKGKLWNLLEVFLTFIRDQVAKPSLGGHHEEDSVHPEHGHELGTPYAEHGRADHGLTAEELDSQQSLAAAGRHHAAHGHHAHDHHANPADRFVPLLWTMFFFVLGCNLMGMVPWAGTPTAAFGVTLALALVTFVSVVASGMVQFGVGGFFLNQIPGMDLPWYMAILIKPMILVIELLGLCIKHGVLAVRLLANMVAGHLVLLAIMGFAFSAEAAMNYVGPGSTWKWGAIGVISLGASAALSCLELFVAFLQAYIFTFLTALFIGAAIHKH